MTQLAHGTIWPKRKKQIQNDEIIKSYTENFDDKNIREFLDIMAVALVKDKITITSQQTKEIDRLMI